jgi:hypothetical protein
MDLIELDCYEDYDSDDVDADAAAAAEDGNDSMSCV